MPQRGVRAPLSEQFLQKPRATRQGPFSQPGPRAGAGAKPVRRGPAQASPRRGRVPIGIVGPTGCEQSRQELARREQVRPGSRGAVSPGWEGGAGRAGRPGPPRGAARGCAPRAGARVGAQGSAGGVFRARKSAAGSERWVGATCSPPAPLGGLRDAGRGGRCLAGPGPAPPGPRRRPREEHCGVFLLQGNQIRN